MAKTKRFQIVNGRSGETYIGPFTTSVWEKHQASFGEKGASGIQSAVVDVFGDLRAQIVNPALNNNTLLVGKVQSGKTSNLECLTALAFDNGYNLMIIYGGYDSELLSQTTKRFRRTFDIDDSQVLAGRKTPVLFTSDDNDRFPIRSLPNVLGKIVDSGTPIIVCTMKNPRRLKELNKILKSANDTNIKALVIDDEGDQASLNNARDKRTDASATYAAICAMKQLLGQPLYCSTTATPHANIFLDELSELRPDSIHLLYPGQGYCGADAYHLQEDASFASTVVEDEVGIYLEENRMPESLKKAVDHFLLASVVMGSLGIADTDMIVHMEKRVKSHKTVYNWIDQYLEFKKTVVEESLSDNNNEQFCQAFSDSYERFFPNEIRKKHPLNSKRFMKEMDAVLGDTYCVLQNSADKNTRNSAGWYYHRIYIGADLLQRGLTFKHLVTTYFTRWARTGGNMDTNLQRARWFGYRNDYIDICKMFTTDEIASEFVNLAYMEDDLWRQFELVQQGEMNISEIVVLAENSRQKPTRRSVASYSRLTVSDWLRQENGTFDSRQIASNNALVEKMLKGLSTTEESLGRHDGVANCLVGPGNPECLYELFSSLEGIFSGSFTQKAVLAELKKATSVAVVQMRKGKTRQRAFYSNGDQTKIKVLQQGRGAKDASATKYEGDASAICDGYGLTIQVHKIEPMHEDSEHPGKMKAEKENTQYMFAIYSPGRSTSGFAKA